MTVEDLQAGMPATLIVFINSKKMEFPVKILSKKKDIICISPIIKNDKTVSFDGHVVHLMFDFMNDVPQVFRSIKLKTCKDKKKNSFYAAKISSASANMNRRTTYRCYVGEKINAQMGTNRKTYDGILKDVSATGFSLVFDKKDLPENYEDFESCHAVYNEFMADIFFNVTLNLTGNIVRVAEVEKDKVVYGCKLIHASPVIEKYIARKEQLALKKKSSSIQQIQAKGGTK